MHAATIASIRINGGRLCLDFINTATWADGRPDWDFLLGADDLLTWGEREGLIDPRQRPRLAVQAGVGEAARMLERARRLRQGLRDLLEPERPAARLTEGLGALNESLADVAGSLRLEAVAGVLRFGSGPDLVASLFGPIAVSAAELVTSPAGANVRVCPGDGCHWLFLDQSRNGARRWCSMESCGNKAKARAHYLAHRGGPRA